MNLATLGQARSALAEATGNDWPWFLELRRLHKPSLPYESNDTAINFPATDRGDNRDYRVNRPEGRPT